MKSNEVASMPRVLSLAQAYARYEAIRDRLPSTGIPGAQRNVSELRDVADEFDGFIFDSFGVLNVGETAISGASECLSMLRQSGKRICVLTNAASYTVDAALTKYRRMGLDVRREEIVSSRDVALAHLERLGCGMRWAAICADEDRFDDSGARIENLLLDERLWRDSDGFLFLSSVRWNAKLQERLIDSLEAQPRPFVIANPDLVAPRENGLSIEPGYWAHDLADRTELLPIYFGKPYAAAFEMALARMGPGRYAMIGDTLHTDILGGQAAGLSTILVTKHGLFSGQDVTLFIENSGIRPDIIAPTI